MPRLVCLLLALWATIPSTFAADHPNIVADLRRRPRLRRHLAATAPTRSDAKPRPAGETRPGFTDAHCTSATCTPSRYALLTGEYAWRKKGTGVLPGDARLIIDPSQITLAGMLRKAGYPTGVVGKWHLGLGDGTIDWNGEIKPGPLEVGFDDSFIMAATGDRVPCVFVENHRIVGLDPADPIRSATASRSAASRPARPTPNC